MSGALLKFTSFPVGGFPGKLTLHTLQLPVSHRARIPAAFRSLVNIFTAAGMPDGRSPITDAACQDLPYFPTSYL